MSALSDALQQIEDRANAATEGPWFVESGNEFVACRKGGVPFDICVLPDFLQQGANPNSDRDAEFIAAAKTDVPALVKALKHARDKYAKDMPISAQDPTPYGEIIDAELAAILTGKAE